MTMNNRSFLLPGKGIGGKGRPLYTVLQKGGANADKAVLLQGDAGHDHYGKNHRTQPRYKTGGLIKKFAFLAKITKEKTKDHGDQTDPAQLVRLHFQNLLKPALHGFG
jgi:hypothetical protein